MQKKYEKIILLASLLCTTALAMATTSIEEKTKRDVCTVTASGSNTVTATCQSGGKISVTFTEECTQTASNCDEAYIVASICANLKASKKARENTSKVAELCGPYNGGGGTTQP